MGLSRRKGSECWQMVFFLDGRRVRMSTGMSNKQHAQESTRETRPRS